MNIQSDRWTGKFGDDYVRRSLLSPDIIAKRSATFRSIFWSFAQEPTSILEVGCNIGCNLLAFRPHVVPPNLLIGVEPNETARRIALMWGLAVYPDFGHDLKFLDTFFDVVFTCGVLMHCDIEMAEKIADEMNRVSKRCLMFMEYFGNEDKEIPYREEKEYLWERPWPNYFKKWGFGEPAVYGFLEPDQGFDSINYWIYPKRPERIL